MFINAKNMKAIAERTHNPLDVLNHLLKEIEEHAHNGCVQGNFKLKSPIGGTSVTIIVRELQERGFEVDISDDGTHCFVNWQ